MATRTGLLVTLEKLGAGGLPSVIGRLGVASGELPSNGATHNQRALALLELCIARGRLEALERVLREVDPALLARWGDAEGPPAAPTPWWGFGDLHQTPRAELIFGGLLPTGRRRVGFQIVGRRGFEGLDDFGDGWDEAALQQILAGLDYAAGQPAPTAEDYLGWGRAQAAAVGRLGDNLLARMDQAGAEQLVIHSGDVGADAIHRLPWELLVLPHQHGPLRCGALLRRVGNARPPPRPRASSSGSLVFGWSAGLRPVPHERHRAALAAAIQRAGLPPETLVEIGDVDPLKLSDAAEALQRAGRPARVVHLLAHGERVGGHTALVLGSRQHPRRANPAQLQDALRSFGRLALVSAHACQFSQAGGGPLGALGPALARAGVGPVVVSQHPLSVDGSCRVAESLFDDLLGPSGSGSLLDATRRAARRLHLDPPAEAAGRVWHDWAALAIFVPRQPSAPP